MFSNSIRSAVSGALVVAALFSSGCTSSQPEEQPMASTVTFVDQFATAADAGMAAVFGTFDNTGRHGARLVAGFSPAAGRVEIHEVVSDDVGSTTMRPKVGGLTVPAEGTHQLVPGGDHLMLMDLTQPLRPGAEVALTLVFDDGSELPVSTQIRDFPGGNEEYQPDAHHG